MFGSNQHHLRMNGWMIFLFPRGGNGEKGLLYYQFYVSWHLIMGLPRQWSDWICLRLFPSTTGSQTSAAWYRWWPSSKSSWSVSPPVHSPASSSLTLSIAKSSPIPDPRSIKLNSPWKFLINSRSGSPLPIPNSIHLAGAIGPDLVVRID